MMSTTAAGSGHPTSCMSAAELVAGTFFYAMKFDPKYPNSPHGDRFVLSKGHAAPVLYAAFAEAGVFPESRLMTLREFSSELEGHPTPRIPGVDTATGSLGQGLSVGSGLAIGARIDKSPTRVYVANRATSPSIKCGFRCESSAGRSLYQLELPLLQFIHGAGTAALGWCLPAAQFWTAV